MAKKPISSSMVLLLRSGLGHCRFAHVEERERCDIGSDGVSKYGAEHGPETISGDGRAEDVDPAVNGDVQPNAEHGDFADTVSS